MRTLTDVRVEPLRKLVDEGEFFWVDLLLPTQADLDRLSEVIGLDRRAVERALRFEQPPQLRRYGDQASLVFYGGDPGGKPGAELVEVHVYVSGGWVVSVRKAAARALDDLRDWFGEAPAPPEAAMVARLLETLADTFNDLLDPLDERILEIEEAAAGASERGQPSRELRHEILARRGRLLRVMRIVRRQRDYADRVVEELSELPGLDPAPHHDMHELAGLMIRVSDRIADALDRLTAALDLLNSTVANRLNAIMERLTVVATVFLPLTVVTGFFGQNFAWMTERIDTFAAFAVLGIGGLAGSALGIYLYVRARLERAPPD